MRARSLQRSSKRIPCSWSTTRIADGESGCCGARTQTLADFTLTPFFFSLLRRVRVCLCPLARDPFTDIGRTIPEFRSVGLAESKEFHGFSVDKKNVFKIDCEAARFLFQYAPKQIDMFPSNLA